MEQDNASDIVQPKHVLLSTIEKLDMQGRKVMKRTYLIPTGDGKEDVLMTVMFKSMGSGYRETLKKATEDTVVDILESRDQRRDRKEGVTASSRAPTTRQRNIQ
jgi:hypothetical protein